MEQRKSYTPPSSPFFEKIVELWEKHKADIISGRLTKHKFYKECIAFDPNLNEGGFFRWVGIMAKHENEQVFMGVVQNSLKYDEMTDEDRKNIAGKLQDKIRYYVKQIFHEKIYEFIQNPQMLTKMTLKEAQKLYADIRREEDREKDLQIKAQGETRKGVLGIFTLQALTNKFTQEQIDSLRAVVTKRLNAQFSKLQSSGGDAITVSPDSKPDNTDNAEGTSTDVPRPTGSVSTG
jgi:uncharacterized CHY-type Zn-finger protein